MCFTLMNVYLLNTIQMYYMGQMQFIRKVTTVKYEQRKLSVTSENTDRIH